MAKKMDSEFSSGLDVVTQAIRNSTVDFTSPPSLPGDTIRQTAPTTPEESSSIQQRNRSLADRVRFACHNKDWLSGWSSLSQLAPECGLHEQFISDIETCAEIYSRIRSSPDANTPIDVGITVKSSPNVDSLMEIGPKGLGGKAWMVDPEYLSIQSRWNSPGFAPMGPTVAFGWNGMNKKTVDREDEESCRAMQMLGTVDYDFDLEAANNAGFARSLEEASRNVVKTRSNIQRGAVAALLNSDLQQFTRSIQMGWVKEGTGSYILGPEDVSPDDWVKTNAMDCALAMGLGYQDSSRHALNRKGIFIGNTLGNCHDVLYDMGCSSRISSVMYARGAGIARHDIHRATVAVAIGCLDNMARRINQMSDTEIPYYGDALSVFSGSWSPFNGRYRPWERFIKYSRQLKRSKSSEARAILDAASRCLVFIEDSPDADMTVIWKKALGPDESEKLTERQTHAYTSPPGDEILNTPGVPIPDICKQCNVSFRQAIHTTDDAIRGIEGLPQSAVSCRALGLAAAIRRAVNFAASDDSCDICACRIGNWADSVAYRVLVTLMMSEEETSPKEWLLQHYLVACVDFWPISVPSVLAGFDLVGCLRYDRGAMGIRDTVDC
ncbi:hypothetical protein VTL71DRAFT_1303 [Oculimacula yallundae]|uniref:Uncharacterized protein n=1 Tax=Oculimacula yallundae TaxID=86028 RepID=A0ABR4CAA3_9HELO